MTASERESEIQEPSLNGNERAGHDLLEIIPYEPSISGRGVNGNPFRVRIRNMFETPKVIVFKESASLLTKAQQDIVNGVLEGDTNNQIAYKRNLALGTVKNQITRIRKRLQNEGFDIPVSSGGGELRIKIVLNLLLAGELELRDSS